ncbi:MAG: PCP reductase family protein [Candidatus Hydrogenedentes bacterium]|nr:PCP reductase family protein [Candidatus Hydrogenedentota bacterium]
MAIASITEDIALVDVEVDDHTVFVDLADGPLRLPLCSLPLDKIEWMENGRRRLYDTIQNGGAATLTGPSHHLPMVTTYSAGATFPFNCCNKGVGFQPKQEYLDECIERLRDVHENTRGKSWRDSLNERVEAARWFYFDRDKIDYRRCATLEIFEKTTFANLQRTPLASLLYTGDAPVFMSFQLNTVVEIINQDDPRHTFTMLMRTLFESEPFHIYQPQFPYAYIFWISEVIDKTPIRVADQPNKMQYVVEEGGIAWDDDAFQAVGRAPSLIQEHIRDLIEDYARQRGFRVITSALVEEAKKQFMPESL